MLAHYMVDVLAWVLPMLFATGWVIGYSHFRNSLRRKHPDLYDTWFRRTHPGAPNGREEDKQA